MTQIADEIVTVLSPIIGKGLAMSAVTMQCRKMGIEPEEISEENIGEFAEHLKKVVQIFAGDQMAGEIARQITARKK